MPSATKERTSEQTTVTNETATSSTSRERRQLIAQRAEDLRTAFERVIARHEAYDPDTISEEDAKALYTDSGICLGLLTWATEDVKADARRRKQNAPYYAACDRLDIPRQKSEFVDKLLGNLMNRKNQAGPERELANFINSIIAAEEASQ